jgi:hypothetical protein
MSTFNNNKLYSIEANDGSRSSFLVPYDKMVIFKIQNNIKKLSPLLSYKIITNPDNTFYLIHYVTSEYLTVSKDTHGNNNSYKVELLSSPTEYSKFKLSKHHGYYLIEGLSQKNNKRYFLSYYGGKYDGPLVLSQGYEFKDAHQKWNFQFNINEFIYKPDFIFDEKKNYNIYGQEKDVFLLIKDNLVYSEKNKNTNKENANFQFKQNIDGSIFILYQKMYLTVLNETYEDNNYKIGLSNIPTNYSRFKISKINNIFIIVGYGHKNEWFLTSILKGKNNAPFVFSKGYDVSYGSKINFQFKILESKFKPIIPLEIENKIFKLKTSGMLLNEDARFLLPDISPDVKFTLIRDGLDHFKIKIADKELYLRYYSEQVRDSGDKVPPYENTKLYFENLNIPDQDITKSENSIFDIGNVTRYIRTIYNTRFNVVKEEDGLYTIYLREQSDNKVGVVSDNVSVKEQDTIYITKKTHNNISFKRLLPTRWEFVLQENFVNTKQNYISSVFVLMLVLVVMLISVLIFATSKNYYLLYVPSTIN